MKSTLAVRVTTSRGERIGVGDRIATRRNDRDLDVANRDTWTVTALDQDGGLQVADGDRRRRPPTEYVASTSSSPTPAPPTAPKARPSTPPTS